MTNVTLDGVEHAILFGQCVEEAKFTDSEAMIGLIRPVTRKCRECDRDTYVTRLGLQVASSRRVYVVCMGCLGAAVDRFAGLAAEEIANAKLISATYKRELAIRARETANGQ